MRDPLRNVSVRYKLAFAFMGVCLLAFGVGGYLVSRSARTSLEAEIITLLRLRSQFHATMLEGDLRALSRRAHDFASDGFIRTRFEDLDDGSRDALREHLTRNKLPLEPAFSNLALVDASRQRMFLARPEDASWTARIPERLPVAADWFSGLLPQDEEGGPPSLVIGTPLSNLDGDRVIGALLVRVHVGAWIASALDASRSEAERAGPEFGLRLTDRAGRALDIPLTWVEDPPAIGSSTVERSLELRVLSPSSPRGATSARGSRVLSQSIPIRLNGWSLETTLDAREALAAVSGLQAKFLLVGLILTAAACLLLLFPMRFLAHPIRRLCDAAVQLREGDFSVRVPVDSTDELGELSRAFNLMAAAVEERTDRLRAAAHSLEQRKNELRSERDRLNAVIHSMRDALIVLDPSGEPEVWNEAAKPLVAVVRNGGMDLSAHRRCVRAEEDVRLGNGAGGDGQRCLGCLFDPSAPPRSCLLDAGPLVYEVHSTRLSHDANGRSGRVLVARDITDRVAKDEREIHQERLAVLGEVAAVMAHELNNPLAAIHMFSQMVESKLPENSPLREDVSVIERNTRACTRTIRELLDYARARRRRSGRWTCTTRCATWRASCVHSANASRPSSCFSSRLRMRPWWVTKCSCGRSSSPDPECAPGRRRGTRSRAHLVGREPPGGRRQRHRCRASLPNSRRRSSDPSTRPSRAEAGPGWGCRPRAASRRSRGAASSWSTAARVTRRSACVCFEANHDVGLDGGSEATARAGRRRRGRHSHGAQALGRFGRRAGRGGSQRPVRTRGARALARRRRTDGPDDAEDVRGRALGRDQEALARHGGRDPDGLRNDSAFRDRDGRGRRGFR